MSLKDRFNSNFPALGGLFAKKQTIPVSVRGARTNEQDANATNDDVVRGAVTSEQVPASLNIKPDGGAKAVTMNKKPLLIAGAVLSAVAAAGVIGFGMMGHHGKPAAQSADTTRAPKSAASPPAPPAPGMPVQPDSATGTPGTTPATGTTPAGTPPAAQTPNKQPTAQQTAVSSALTGGQGIGTGGWASGETVATKSASQTSFVAQGQPSQSTPPGGGAPTALSAVNDQSGLGVYDTHLVRRPASPFEVMQGSVIQATLTTGIESDLPGQITAIVSRNIFDSAAGSNLLIPAGAQLVGSYATQVLPGQSGVAVAWNRIIFPNGSYMNLGVMPGADPNGMSGLTGDVDNHTWLMFKNALLLSVVSTAMAGAQPQTAGIAGQATPAGLFTQQFSQTFGTAEAQLLQKYTKIAPTIHVQPGDQMVVVVSKDLVFPGPYTSAMQAKPQAARSTAPAAMVNPYPTEQE